MNKTGVCLEHNLPYADKFSDQTTLIPPDKIKNPIMFNVARRFTTSGYIRLVTVQDMMESLNNNGPFLLALKWKDDWMNIKTQRGYPILKVKRTSKSIGGHAICVVGYDTSSETFKIRNSWGTRWGKGGYAVLPFKSLENTMMDAWATFDAMHPLSRVDEVR